jgi:threonylcarbamoyladenosine tRNA methylthiotransferase MtaB
MEQINGKKICVYTLGCKVNKYESNSLINALREKGFFVTEELEVCDKYIINTCAVTAEAERKSKQVIAKINRLNENAQIIVMGCASQNNAKAFLNKKNVKFISGTADKQNIANMLEREGVDIKELPDVYEETGNTCNVQTRAFIKIQDGCDNFCSYCIIPYLRGRSRSRSIQSVKNEILSLAGEVKEFVITGINISAYGKDTGSSLTELIENLSDIDARIRLGSLEAGTVEKNLLCALKKLKNFCPHFHLSLQSGSNKILKAMNRHYTAEEFYSGILLIREFFPFAAVTTDIICGFPDETEEDFECTVTLCEKAKLADIHIFPYSKREGTAAAKFKGLPSDLIKQRVNILKQLKQRLKNSFTEINMGEKLFLLTETYENGYCTGYSENYLKLYVKENLELNKIYCVKPFSRFKDGAEAKTENKN